MHSSTSARERFVTDFLGAIERQRAEEPTPEQSLAAWREHGLEGQPVLGNTRSGRHMLSFPHDGVPYCLDHYGKLEKIPRGVLHRKLTIERHHAMVKAVYEHCVATAGKPIWAMCGGGSQLQVFYGDAGGYLGILYLDLEDLEEHKRLSDIGYLAAVGNETYTLVTQRAGSEKVFQGMKVPGVEVRRFGA